MPVPNLISRSFLVDGGLNTRSNDIIRDLTYSRNCENFELSETLGLSNIKGFKVYAPTKGGGGLDVYERLNTTTKETDETTVCIDNNLWILQEGSITLSYSGSESINTFELIPYTDGAIYGFKYRVIEGTSTLIDTVLGTGRDTAVPHTIANLVTAIDALANFACSASGTTTGPAAALSITEATTVGASLVIYFKYWEQVICPTTNPFAAFWATVNTETFENAALQNCDNILYIATGYNKLYKYDGHATYRAGMPAATALSGAESAGGSLTLLSEYEWFITYEFVDARSRVTEGDESNRVKFTLTAANASGLITIPYLKAATEFYTNSALANNGGTETGTTLTVDNGAGGAHTIQIGDAICFYDNGGTWQERTVTNRSNSSITISGAAVTIANNEVISANLKINLWRNAAGDTELKYLVKTFANDGISSTTTFNYDDGLADATLIGYADYVYPEKGHGIPPDNLKYLTVYQGLLIGNDGTDKVDFSDYDGPEYFPAGISDFTVRSKAAGMVTGVAANRELLLITKEDETHIVIGDLPGSNYRQELIADAIGCSSYHSMVDIDGSLWFYSRTHGVRRIISSGLPDDMSFRIWPEFVARLDSEASPRPKRAVAVYFADRRQYILFIPSETDIGATMALNSHSRLLICDARDANVQGEDGYPKTRWFPQSGFNMVGGIIVKGGRLYWSERYYSSTLSAYEYPLVEQLINDNQYDYCFHAQPYDITYETTWLHLDDPSVLKKWIKTKLYSLEDSITGGFSVDVSAEADMVNGNSVSSTTLVFGEASSSEGFGISPFGPSSFGDPAATSKQFDFIPFVSPALKLVISRTVWCENVVFSGYEVQVVAAFEKEITDEV